MRVGRVFATGQFALFTVDLTVTDRCVVSNVNLDRFGQVAFEFPKKAFVSPMASCTCSVNQ